MKKLIVIVVIIIALVLGSYYGTGYITERTLKRDMAMLSQSNGLFFDFVNYNRGLFTSDALVNVKMHIPERVSKDQNGQSITLPAEDYNLNVPLKIYHGPIIFADSTVKFGLGYAVTDITVPENYNDKFNSLFSNTSTKPISHIALFVNYLNTSYLNLGIPKFKLVSKQDNDLFEWLGMESDIKLTSNLQDIVGDLNLEGMNVIKKQEKTYVGKISSNYDLHQHAIGLYVGKADIDLSSLIIFDNLKRIFELSKFNFASSSDITNGLFNSYTNFSLEKFIHEDKVYGPAYFDFSIKNLDAQVLADLNQKVSQAQQNNSERQQALLAILPDLPKLFGRGPQLEVSRLSVIMPEGKLEGNMKINVPENQNANPFQLLQSVQGEAHISIPSQVVKDFVGSSIRSRLQANNNLQQIMAQQLQQNTANNTESTTQPAPNTNTSPNAGTTVNASKPLNPEDLDKMVTTQTDLKLKTMQDSGLLVQNNDYFVIDVILKDGQFTINGKPFSSEMTQF